MISGCRYEGILMNDPTKFNIILPNNFKVQWNFISTSVWAIDEDLFDQVGCIYTSNGLEFDYVGVIIGKK